MRFTRPRKSEGLGVGLLRLRGMELEHQLLGPEIEGTKSLEGETGPGLRGQDGRAAGILDF